jgi:hypothetical protein
MASTHFCTYFDKHYLLKGLALQSSLEAHAGNSGVWVLCLDNVVFDVLATLARPPVRAVRLSELEAWEPRLAEARNNRSLVEFYWTCTATLVAYVLNQVPEGDLVAYVDSDLFFFASPESALVEAGDSSIIIHGHRYAPAHAHLAPVSGLYNVGLTAFRQDARGWRALRWWQDACLTACYAQPRDGYFGDQKYLDDWPERFDGVCELTHVGAGLAPWNVGNYAYSVEAGEIRVDERPLIFFHFHWFQALAKRLFWQKSYDIPPLVRDYAYRPYIRCLQEQSRVVPVQYQGLDVASSWPRWQHVLKDAWHRRMVWQ